VLASVCETYLIHAENDFNLNGRNKNVLLGICGTIMQLVRDCGPPVELCIGITDPEIKKAIRDRILTRLQVLSYSLDIAQLEDANLNCTDDVFMETLLLNVKNNVISHQAFMRKTKREKINSLRKDLLQQKKDYVLNQVRILQLEQELNNLIDWEMRSKLTSFQHFDILNGEKMTPRFLTLAKISKKKLFFRFHC
jgi:hypothetical protein